MEYNLRPESLEAKAKKLEVVVLASGGLDSTACMAFCRDRGYQAEALFIDYGQASAANERQAVQRVTRHYQIPLTCMELSGVGPFESGFIPARNALLLSLALSKTDINSGLVLMGIHAGTSYVDCSGSFVEAFQRVFDLYTGGRLRIHCPFLEWTKPEVWKYCHQVGVPISLTYSCERGGEVPCGHCLSCKDREVLLELQ